ncbi:MAG: autotransporter outer membrane beta-barrel domain-containing protein, partial [Gammaproteobacteria bacterium]|nr:autotransporter outer membrane beta-barrel domain-containing protein [Gammaproteobacteria bacterium]
PPPPPALRGIISGALLAALAAVFLLAAPVHAQTLSLTATGSNGDRDPAAPGLQVDEGDTVTLTLSLSGASVGIHATNPVGSEGTAVFNDDYMFPGRLSGFSLSGTSGFTESKTLTITDDDIPEPDETIIIPMLTRSVGTVRPTNTAGPLTITIRQNDGYVAPVAPGPAADSPAARAMRLEAPVAAVARGIGLLAAEAAEKRVGVGGDGFNFWTSGGYVSADGEHESITYDGNTTALHLGLDTKWRDGLLGIAIAHSDGDMDFNNTDNLETTVTSVHPYSVRQFNNSRLWTTIGYGIGDAELKEPDTVIKTDVNILTAGFGLAHVQSDLLTATIGALLSRARLDSATGNNKTLPAVTVSTLRVTAGAEAGWSHGDWRPFLTVNLRHDAGDGEDGGAADLGGGVEWQSGNAHVRLEGAGHGQGNGPDENRLSLTAGKTAGRLNLGLTVTANDGIDTANLLTGKWRF